MNTECRHRTSHGARCIVADPVKGGYRKCCMSNAVLHSCPGAQERRIHVMQRHCLQVRCRNVTLPARGRFLFYAA